MFDYKLNYAIAMLLMKPRIVSKIVYEYIVIILTKNNDFNGYSFLTTVNNPMGSIVF